MKIIITEEQKKKLFIPRKLSGEGSRWEQWNKEQPVVDGVRINQYNNDGEKDGIWLEFYDEDDELYGSLESKQSYKNGEKDGVWEYYLESGELYYKSLYKNDKYVKILPKEITESEQSKKGKLFIPRRIDDREIEAEKLKQKYISDIKGIINDNGTIIIKELDGNSIVYGYSPDEYDEVAIIEKFYSDHVGVVVYGQYGSDTFNVPYEELNLEQLSQIFDLLLSGSY
jgi:hypothetical protein